MKKLKDNKLFKIIKAILNVFFTLLIVLFLLVVCLQRLSNNELSFFNYRMFTVASGSMEPLYQIGDVLIAKETEGSPKSKFYEKSGYSAKNLVQDLDLNDPKNRYAIIKMMKQSEIMQLLPLMSKKAYSYEIEFLENNRDTINKQVISGYTCMENDRLFIAEDKQELKVGDRIIFKKVGAYTMCLTPLFIEYFPDVYLEDNNRFEIVRKRWTADKILES